MAVRVLVPAPKCAYHAVTVTVSLRDVKMEEKD